MDSFQQSCDTAYAFIYQQKRTTAKEIRKAGHFKVHELGDILFHLRLNYGVVSVRGKAMTSAMMKKPSGVIETATLAHMTLVNFNDGRLPTQGGMPVFTDLHFVGAVGISGGTPDQDEIIAQAGINAWCPVAGIVD